MQLLARHVGREGSGDAILRFRCPHCGNDRGVYYAPVEPVRLVHMPKQAPAKAIHCPDCNGVFYRREVRNGNEVFFEAFANLEGWLPPEMIAPMPSQRRFVGAALSGGKLLVLGGVSEAGTTRLTTVESYDPVENTWAMLPALVSATSGPAVIKGQKVWQYGASAAVAYNVLDGSSKAIPGLNVGNIWGQSAVDALGNKLFLASAANFYEIDSELETFRRINSLTLGGYSNLAWDEQSNIYYGNALALINIYNPSTGAWTSQRVGTANNSGMLPARTLVSEGEVYGFHAGTNPTGKRSEVWKWLPGGLRWSSTVPLDKGVNGPALVGSGKPNQFLVVDGTSEWPIQFYEAMPAIKTSIGISLRTNEIPTVLPVRFESPASRMPIEVSVPSSAALSISVAVPKISSSELSVALKAGNISATLPTSFQIIATKLPVRLGVPLRRLMPVYLSVDTAQVSRRILRNYLTIAQAPQKLVGVSFTAPRTVIVGGGAIQPGEVHAATINLSATEKDQWQGSITTYTPLKPGTIALRIANIEVLANIEQVQVALVGGQTTYTGQIRPSTAPNLNRVITIDLPEDPVISLEANGGYVSPQQIFNLRNAAPRPTAREYFMQAGESARVVVLIDSNVPGADMPLPYRDVWTGSGKTFQTALTEVFGFAKPRIYVDSIGRIRVSRRRRPREFGEFTESPQSRTIAGSLAPLPESVPTFYAGPAAILLPMAGGSKATNQDILRKKYGSDYPDLEYYAEWWSSANKTTVPFQDQNTTPPREGHMRITPIIFWVEKPERPNRPPIPKGAWHALGIRFAVGNGIRKR